MPILNYNSLLFNQDKEYRKWLKYVYRSAQPLLVDVARWWVDYPEPDENGYAKSENVYKFMHYNKSIKILNFAISNCRERAVQMMDTSLSAALVMELRKFQIKIKSIFRIPSLYMLK